MNFYAFHIGDYSSATQHLTELEDLAYRRMMDVYYVSERALPLERRQIYRLIRANSEAMREAVDVVLSEFFTCEDDGWHHKRCDLEIAKAKAKSEKAKANGKLGGEAKAKRPLDESVANATPEPSEPLAPNPNPNPSKEDDEEDTRARKKLAFERLDVALKQLPELKGQPVSAVPVLAPIFGLMWDKGLDLDTQILPSIRRQAVSASKPIKGWSYFVPGILQDAENPSPTGAPYGSQPRRRSTPGQDMRDAIAAVQAHVAERD